MHHAIISLLLLSGALLLNGCGQLGPLYLPEDPAEATAEQQPETEESRNTDDPEQTTKNPQ